MRRDRIEWLVLAALLVVACALLAVSVWRFVPCGGAAVFCP